MNNVTRRTFLGAAAGAASLPLAADTPKRPNFVFFMPDEMRAESLGCYGHPLTKTPNFNRLAAEGTRFEQCHVQNTVCAPSRCSLMTGWPVHVRGHRSLYYGLHPDEPNLLRYFKDNGYDVYWYGKNDLLAPETFALSVTDWGSKGGDTVFRHNPWKQDDPHYYSFLWERMPDRRKTTDYANLQAAIQILERKSDKPFCIYLPLIFPHPPFAAPEGFHDM
jgi:arylsulfatase A-like enzyme